MTEVRARVGSKGRIVIPKVVREALGLRPGGEVIFSIHGRTAVLRGSRTDVVELFERIAKSGVPTGKHRPHQAYEGEMQRSRS